MTVPVRGTLNLSRIFSVAGWTNNRPTPSAKPTRSCLALACTLLSALYATYSSLTSRSALARPADTLDQRDSLPQSGFARCRDFSGERRPLEACDGGETVVERRRAKRARDSLHFAAAPRLLSRVSCSPRRLPPAEQKIRAAQARPSRPIEKAKTYAIEIAVLRVRNPA